METDNVTMHKKVCDELTDLYRRKNHDYGGSFHLSYVKWGLPMAAIRLGDKLQRFETLIRAESQVDESVRDTLVDLANYAIMTVMELDREEKKSGEVYRIRCAHCGFIGEIPVATADVNLKNFTVACPNCGTGVEMSV